MATLSASTRGPWHAHVFATEATLLDKKQGALRRCSCAFFPLSLSSWKGWLQFAKKVSGSEVSWALGAGFTLLQSLHASRSDQA